MAWDHRYRMLAEGEIIRATDEVEIDKPYGWRAPRPENVGTRAPSPLYTSHRRYRRLKDAREPYDQGPAKPKSLLAVHPTPVILVSPYAGDVPKNVDYARACMADSLARGEAPFASHLLYTQAGVLDDGVLAEGYQGMRAGWSWGRYAKRVVVYTDLGISEGMLEGIEGHIANGMWVEYRSLYPGEAEAQLKLRRPWLLRLFERASVAAGRWRDVIIALGAPAWIRVVLALLGMRRAER